LEGSEAASWLNELGITVFVLRYRTAESGDEKWKRPLQDSQRAMRWIRHHAARWQLDPRKLGLLGFSAGGQVAACHMTATEPAYASVDDLDELSYAPAFSILIYPWQVYDEAKGGLKIPIKITEKTPPAFIVHTDDDASSSLGAVMVYAELKRHRVSGELHVYQNGGHGYGLRSRPNSAISTWKDRCTEWLKVRQANEATQ
jgi:acetyl esterase/lipase